MSGRLATLFVLAATALAGSVLAVRVCLAQPEGGVGGAAARAGARFGWVDVVIDSGDQPLAAYQIEVHDTRGRAVVVGIEGSGGVGGPFSDAPYYDPAALMNDRIIIAALSTEPAASLPSGRARVARLHVRIAAGADPVFSLKLHVATGPDAAPIQATASLILGENP